MIFVSINWLFVLIINVLGPRWIRGQPWLSVDVCWLSLCGLLIMIMRIGCWGWWGWWGCWGWWGWRGWLADNNRIAFRLNATLAKVQELAAITLHTFGIFFKTMISYFFVWISPIHATLVFRCLLSSIALFIRNEPCIRACMPPTDTEMHKNYWYYQ